MSAARWIQRLRMNRFSSKQPEDHACIFWSKFFTCISLKGKQCPQLGQLNVMLWLVGRFWGVVGFSTLCWIAPIDHKRTFFHHPLLFGTKGCLWGTIFTGGQTFFTKFLLSATAGIYFGAHALSHFCLANEQPALRGLHWQTKLSRIAQHRRYRWSIKTVKLNEGVWAVKTLGSTLGVQNVLTY